MDICFAVLLGSFYTLFVGFLIPKPGIAATIFAICILVDLRSRLRSSGRNTKWTEFLFVLGGILALIPFLLTNKYAFIVSSLAVFLIAWLLLLIASGVDTAKISIPLLLSASIERLKHSAQFSIKTLINLKAAARTRDRELIIGTCISIPILFAFHLFFVHINGRYDAWMREAIDYLLDLTFWKYLVQMIFQSFLLYVLLNAPTQESASPSLGRFDCPSRRWGVVLLLLVLLFAIFSTFQSQVLFADLENLPFRELSLYAQSGFRSLLIVSLAGFAVWHFSSKNALSLAKLFKVKPLLLFFLFELLLIGVFSAHKIVSLQMYFGFKDQRIFASALVCLILLSFVMCFFEQLKLISKSSSFRVQFTSFVIITVALSYLNVDYLATKYHSIRFWKEGSYHKDFSYLLGNSYDNFSCWGELMAEAEVDGVPIPEKYYWGVYRGLRPSGGHATYLRLKHRNLLSKYDHLWSSPRTIGGFNLREFGAYRWLRSNQESVEKFYEFLETNNKKI